MSSPRTSLDKSANRASRSNSKSDDAERANRSSSKNTVLSRSVPEQKLTRLRSASNKPYNSEKSRQVVQSEFNHNSKATANPKIPINPLVARITVANTAQAIAKQASDNVNVSKKEEARESVGLESLTSEGGPKVLLLANSGEAASGAGDYLEYNREAIESNPDKFLFVLDNLPVDFDRRDLENTAAVLPKFLRERPETLRGLDNSPPTRMLNKLSILSEDGRPFLEEQGGARKKEAARDTWIEQVAKFLDDTKSRGDVPPQNMPAAYKNLVFARGYIAEFKANPSPEKFEQIYNEVSQMGTAISATLKRNQATMDIGQFHEKWSQSIATIAEMNTHKTIIVISTDKNILSATFKVEPETDDNGDIVLNPDTLSPVGPTTEHRIGMASRVTLELANRGLGTALPILFSMSASNVSFGESVEKSDFGKGTTEACLTIPCTLFAPPGGKTSNAATRRKSSQDKRKSKAVNEKASSPAPKPRSTANDSGRTTLPPQTTTAPAPVTISRQMWEASMQGKGKVLVRDQGTQNTKPNSLGADGKVILNDRNRESSISDTSSDQSHSPLRPARKLQFGVNEEFVIPPNGQNSSAKSKSTTLPLLKFDAQNRSLDINRQAIKINSDIKSAFIGEFGGFLYGAKDNRDGQKAQILTDFSEFVSAYNQNRNTDWFESQKSKTNIQQFAADWNKVLNGNNVSMATALEQSRNFDAINDLVMLLMS